MRYGGTLTVGSLIGVAVSNVRKRDEKCKTPKNQHLNSIIYNYYHSILLIPFPSVSLTCLHLSGISLILALISLSLIDSHTLSISAFILSILD
jgi:hypothetical protein